MYNYNRINYPVFQIRSKSVVCYTEYLYSNHKSNLFTQQQRALTNFSKNKAYSGTMTVGAKKRLTRAVSLLVQSSKSQWLRNPVTKKRHQFRLSFTTLTIPETTDKPSGKYCNKELLEPFLRTMRRKYNLKSYVWKLELQQNGMVHYHITSNLYLHHSTIRNEWNYILRKNGLLKEFEQRHGHDNPNSTDIHSVRAVKNLEAYLVKYVTKETQNTEKLNCKIWDASLNLKQNNYYSNHLDWSYEDRLKELLESNQCSVFLGERFRIYKFKQDASRLLLNKKDFYNYQTFLTKIRNHETANQSEKPLHVLPNSDNTNRSRGLLSQKTVPKHKGRDYELSQVLEKRSTRPKESVSNLNRQTQLNIIGWNNRTDSGIH